MLPPFSLLGPPRLFGPPIRQWATTVRAPHVCVNTHTVMQCSQPFLVCYMNNRSAVGVMAHNTQHNKASLHLVKRIRLRRVLWRLWYFNNETRRGGYLGRGWEGIGGKDLWLWLPEVREPRHGGERDCSPRLSPAGAPLPAARCPLSRRPGSVAPAGDNRGQQSQAIIPSSSMSRFSLLSDWCESGWTRDRRTRRSCLRSEYRLEEHTDFGLDNI